MERVLKGSRSFTCTPRVHPLTEWTTGASTPFKPWSKCSMEKLGGAFQPILGAMLTK